MTTFHQKIPASVFKGIAFESGIGKLSHVGLAIQFKFDYPPVNRANERSEICVVSRGGNFFN